MYLIIKMNKENYKKINKLINVGVKLMNYLNFIITRDTFWHLVNS